VFCRSYMGASFRPFERSHGVDQVDDLGLGSFAVQG